VSTFRRDLASVLTSLTAEGPVEITRNGSPIALLVPPPQARFAKKPKIDVKRLARVCRRHHIQRLALFGSILRDDFSSDSDVDVLIDPEHGHLKTFAEIIQAHDSLVKVFGRPVDLLKRAIVEKMTNEIRRRSILETARVIYEA